MRFSGGLLAREETEGRDTHGLVLEAELVPLGPGTRDVELVRALAAPDHGAAGLKTDGAELVGAAAAAAAGERRRGVWATRELGGRTEDQREWGIVLMPSTTRRREASENVISGMNTEQRTCAQPWPSVGLHTRRYDG